MKRFRTAIFWCHLFMGVSAGLVILIMSVTGALLAFQPQILNAVERHVRTVERAPNTQRVGIQAMLVAALHARPGAQPTGLTLDADDSASAAVTFGRDVPVYVDPYTGHVLGDGSRRWRAFFQALTDWHRWLARAGDGRAIGRAITGACTLAFLALAVSGPYLWWPRTVTWRNVKAVIVFRRGATGRARDFNWHNVIGFWCAPVLIILTASGVVMSYPWATRLLYRVTGSAPPAPVETPAPARGQTRPSPGDRRQDRASTLAFTGNLDLLWAHAEEQVPTWRSITLRLPNRPDTPVSFAISDRRSWNKFARSQLTLAPLTGDVVKWEPYEHTSVGQKMRGWLRFAHTGELGGLPGQLVAALASAGGAVLVWTGMALAVRRLFSWRRWKRFRTETERPIESPVSEGGITSPATEASWERGV